MSARIIGTGSCLPSLVVDNRKLEEIVDTTDEWIRSRTGIESRHIAVEETTTSMAIAAAQAALEDAGISAGQLDLILVGTIFPTERALRKNFDQNGIRRQVYK